MAKLFHTSKASVEPLHAAGVPRAVPADITRMKALAPYQETFGAAEPARH